jgi:leucine-rich repeat-containing protein 49
MEILFVEIPQIPKVLVIYRRPRFRLKNLDKMYLNKLDLPHVPLLEARRRGKFEIIKPRT